MRFVRINHDVDVNPEDVSSISTDSNRTGVLVRMRDGEQHWVKCDYGKTVYDTKSRLITELENPPS
jgi:hypothetical protein